MNWEHGTCCWCEGVVSTNRKKSDGKYWRILSGGDTIWFIFDGAILDAQEAVHAGNTDVRVGLSQQREPGSR